MAKKPLLHMAKKPFQIPQCCVNCAHYDSEWSESTWETYHYCGLGVFFPVRKQSCRRQKLYKSTLTLFLEKEQQNDETITNKNV